MSRQQKRGLMTVAVIGAVAVVYGLFWNYLAGRFRAGIEQWAAERQAEGYQIGFSSLRVGGVPPVCEDAVGADVVPGNHGVAVGVAWFGDGDDAGQIGVRSAHSRCRGCRRR